MKKKIGKWLSIGLPLILGIYLIYYKYNEFTTEQIHEIKGYFKNANYFYIYLSLVIALFGFISRAYRWKYAIQHLGYQTHFYNNLMAVCVGYFMNLTIPRSGEFSRALVLKNYENMPFDKAFGTIVAERVVDTLIFLLFVFASLLFQFNVLKNYVLTKIPVENLIILASIGFVGFVLLLLLWIYSNWKIVSAIKEKLSGLIEGMSSILKMEQKWKFLFHSFFIWFTYILMFYVTIFALKETSNISFGAVIIAFVFGTLAVGFTNSGFGVYPLLIAEIFMLYGVPDTAGTAFGWLTWASQTILMIVLGGLSFLFLPILNRK
ncbi:flippase-like domain-containing protein [Flavobacterium psychrophilum]|uniref:TIGR00374 family protein n=3 Tax=Flavobacterium psychrophilum TaxID=96345 RepID=A6GVV1_FLAPJ|nr:lysylphosphatidylglycerol synthase transmembrane domain-containing protein [Flavobacterium psychrophilum]AIG29054.1 membrane protein [Flavobacterium psychrophilum]AIG31330.1 membrane protein [Flavobacterium psychrophilum]AIG35750.1 membrane protein [Flavobacterium psychrophilum]AIG35856.1 membrane protein [Flavobacterium psychrophilum]AIG38111.1 membrane protein [Flavobacterium psychrophilum]